MSTRFVYRKIIGQLLRSTMSIFEQILAEAKKHFVDARGSHDFDHVERVLKMAVHIGKKEKADLEILRIAAVLHDISRKSQDHQKGKTDHAQEGASEAMKILKFHKVSDEKIAKIIHCIESHRFRSSKKPQTLEAKILFDADKLDSIGAIGIGRAFLFAGEIKAKLHNPGKTDTEILKTQEYSPDDTAYREFLIKLSKIKSRLHTKTGRKLAESRHDFMVEFFKTLKKEITF